MKILPVLPTLFALSVLPASAAEPAAGANAHPGMTNPHMMAPAVAMTQTGKVLSTIDVPQYTYIQVSQGNKTVWIATNTVRVKKGDNIRFDQGMAMSNFYSRTLKRTFPSILFVSSVAVAR
jgi:hypothetical protein